MPYYNYVKYIQMTDPGGKEDTHPFPWDLKKRKEKQRIKPVLEEDSPDEYISGNRIPFRRGKG